MNFEKASAAWIWVPKALGDDQYADFMTEFTLKTTPDSAQFMISVDSDYSLWINGRWVDAGHYDDFPAHRTHDILEVAEYLRAGVNRIAVTAYYQGKGSHQYITGAPGVIYALYDRDRVLAVSGPETICRVNPVYASGASPLITDQLGFAFEADARREDGWLEEGYRPKGWKKAQVMTGELYSLDTEPRPVEKLILKERVQPEVVAQGQFIHKQPLESTAARRIYTDYLSPLTPQALFASGVEPLPFATEVFLGRGPVAVKPEAYQGSDGFYLVLDLGREEAGLFELDLEAPEGVEVEVAWGQHLTDLRVRAYVGGRNFGCRYVTRAGRQRFFCPFRRMGGRYMQLHFACAGAPVTLHYAGIAPWEYPVTRAGRFTCPDSLHNRIWEVSRRTLELCMHEHYEDTPWREQSFYVADSRNQALCGYYAFGEYAFPEASFGLYKDAFEGPLYSDICAPCHSGLCIPAFTLNWPVAIYEHWMYSGSRTLMERCWDRVTTALDEALNRLENGLMKTPGDPGMWNFYEWSDGMADEITRDTVREIARFEAPLQLFLIRSLQCAAKMAQAMEDEAKAQRYGQAAETVAQRVNEVFWQPQRGLYATFYENGRQWHEAELTQALALYDGIVPPAEEAPLREKLMDGEGLVTCTLSYSIFKYEAILMGGEAYAKAVFDQIARDWGMMLYKDSTSFWETILGQKDFGYAGSLCHGWSAVPLYLYMRYVLGVRPLEPGFTRFEVDPVSVFSEVSGTVPTPAGDIYVTVRCDDEGKDIEVDAPDSLIWEE